MVRRTSPLVGLLRTSEVVANQERSKQTAKETSGGSAGQKTLEWAHTSYQSGLVPGLSQLGSDSDDDRSQT